jgi:hypothetical protein
MASDLITTYSSFTPNKITYGTPRINARGGKSIKILDTKKNTLVLSTPLILTWGINKIVDEDSGRTDYNFSLQFPSSDYGNENTNEFFEKMKQLESKILDDVVDNSKDWFGKAKMSREVAEALFTPMLKYPKDKATNEPDYSRSPTMRIKIPCWDGRFNIELYEPNQKPIFKPDTELGSTPFESLIPKGSHVAAAIQCNGLWFAAGKFGVTWQLVQAIVRRPVRIQGGCFLKLNTEDNLVVDDANKRESENIIDDTTTHIPEPVSTTVDDSDDDVSDEEAPPTPPPEPKKKVTKRKVIKKKSSA